MKIILDTNILISALIRDSFTRKIILESNLDFYFPEITLNEIRKYRELILEKSNLTERGYNTILFKLFKNITLTPTEEIKENLKEAKEIMKNIDVKDSVFIAAAISHGAIIWSDDKHFMKQNKIKIYNTSEIIKILD